MFCPALDRAEADVQFAASAGSSGSSESLSHAILFASAAKPALAPEIECFISGGLIAYDEPLEGSNSALIFTSPSAELSTKSFAICASSQSQIHLQVLPLDVQKPAATNSKNNDLRFPLQLPALFHDCLGNVTACPGRMSFEWASFSPCTNLLLLLISVFFASTLYTGMPTTLLPNHCVQLPSQPVLLLLNATPAFAWLTDSDLSLQSIQLYEFDDGRSCSWPQLFLSTIGMAAAVAVSTAVAVSFLTSTASPSISVSSCESPSRAVTLPMLSRKQPVSGQGLFGLRAAFRRSNFIHLDSIKCIQLTACACLLFALPAAGAAAAFSVTVDPMNGIDSLGCGLAASCKTISFAVLQNNMSVSSVTLTAGHFVESTVNISSFESLAISGVPSATFFYCSRRVIATGAAFEIENSTVAISGITFVNCSNAESNGGAVSARGSSLTVSQCSFINCSAASGGAISVAGRGSAAVFNVQNSSFFGNSAHGGLSGCSSVSSQPCSTWGGAIAVFEVFDVSVSGCTMVANNARASVPSTSLQMNASRNAVAGGGCLSVLFYGNSSGFSVRFIDNKFEQCAVDVSNADNVDLGNGEQVFASHAIAYGPRFTRMQAMEEHCQFTLDCRQVYGFLKCKWCN